MKQFIKWLIPALLLVAACAAQNLQPNITTGTLSAQYVVLQPINAPGNVVQVSLSQAMGGTQTYYYWIIGHNAAGAQLSGPFVLNNAPATLSAAYPNTISWIPALAAFPAQTYDLLRTTSNTPPTGACGCAVATASTLTYIVDSLASTTSFLVPPLLTPTILSQGTSNNAFGGLTSGTNTTASMLVGSGAFLGYTGTGSITSSNSDCLGASESTTFNVSCGLSAGSPSTSTHTTAFGFQALSGGTAANNDTTAIGYQAAHALGTNQVDQGVVVGSGADTTATCHKCVNIGFDSYGNTGTQSGTSASSNVGVGWQTLAIGSPNTLTRNTAVGAAAMQNVSGLAFDNVAIGQDAMQTSSNMDENVFIGSDAGSPSGGVTGSNNVGVGFNVASPVGGTFSGGNNTMIGNASGLGITSGSNDLCLGSGTCASSVGSNHLDLAGALTGTYTGAGASLSFNVPVTEGVTTDSGIQSTTHTVTICSATSNAVFCGVAQALTATVSVLDKGGCTGGNTDSIAGSITYFDAAGSHTLTSSGFSSFPIGSTNTGFWNASFAVASSSGFHDVTLTITKTNGSCSGAASYEVVTNVNTGVGAGSNSFNGAGGGIAAASVSPGNFPAGSFAFPSPLSVGGIVQPAASTFGGTCTMAAGTTCTITLAHTFTTPVCIATVQGATPNAAACSVSGATVTITAATSNSATWGAVVIGNPN